MHGVRYEGVKYEEVRRCRARLNAKAIRYPLDTAMQNSEFCFVDLGYITPVSWGRSCVHDGSIWIDPVLFLYTHKSFLVARETWLESIYIPAIMRLLVARFR